MKKVLFLVLALCAVTTTASAKIFGFGVTAGMNVNKTDVSEENKLGLEPDAKSGWYVGLQAKFTLPIVGFGVDGAITYSQNEATMKLDKQVGGKDLTSFDKTVGYITVPVHLRYDLNLPIVSNFVAPYVFTGPQASYALSKLEDDFSKEEKDLLGYKTEDFAWKWDLGLGAILLDHLQVSYAYEFPLSKTSSFTDAALGVALKGEYKQGTHRIGVTYFF